MTPSRTYGFGPFRLETASYRLFVGDRPIPLPPKVIDLLRLLLSRPSELVTKDDILEALWPGTAVTDNAVTQVVSELRQALGDQSASPTYIQTVPRRGYRFIALVEVRTGTESAAAGVVRGGGHQMIAVSDFQNVSADADVAWLAAGIAETLTNDLRALRDLTVVERADLPDEARRGSIAAAREGGLDLLVVGSYQRAGAQLRMTARVIGATSGEAVAHAKVDGPVADVFVLQDGLVTQLLAGLHVPVPPAAAARIGVRETSSLDAYRALTEGRLKLETLDPADVLSAIEDFERALTLDPRYALAHVGLANARFWRHEMSRAHNRPDVDELRAAIAQARRAIELDPALAEAHGSLAFFLARDLQQAEAIAAGRTAVALEPNDWRHRFRLGVAAWGAERLVALQETSRLYPELGHSYLSTAMLHVARNDLAAAEVILRLGLSVQRPRGASANRYPTNGLHWLLGLVRLAQGAAPAEASEHFDRELAARGRELYGAEYAMDAFDALGFARLAAGDATGAADMFEKALEIYPDHARSLVGLAQACQLGGDAARAKASLDHAGRAVQELHEGGRGTESSMAAAYWHLASGRQEDALATLDRLLAEAPPGSTGWTIPVEPWLASLRDVSAFRAVLRRLAERAT